MAVAIGQRQDAGSVEPRIDKLSSDGLIIALLQTPNHLSRWLTPIHDWATLDYSPRRAQPSVKDVLLRMRDVETRAYGLMNAIATEINPDLDRVPRVERTARQVEADRQADALVIMSEFRRVRQSSTSLLRALPDTAWERGGYSRTERNWTIRQLGEHLARHDRDALREIDRILSQSDARRGIASVSRVSYEEIEKPFVAPAAPRDGEGH
jgi:hypothetical protein